MADEKDAPPPGQPAAAGPEAKPQPAGTPPTAPPDHAPSAHPAGTEAAAAPPTPTPPMTAAPGQPAEAAPAPRSNAASGVTEAAPARPEGVAPAEPTVPPGAPAPVKPAPPAAGTDKPAAPAAVATKGPDSPTPGGPNPGAEAARATAAPATPAAAPKPAVTAAPAPAAAAVKPAAPATAPAEGVSRRGFLKWTTVGWVAFSAACTSSLVATTRFLFPNVLFEPPQAFKAGFPSEYNVGDVDTRWKDAFGVWIVREPDQFFALIAVCTHLGCSPNWLAAENKFKCPCHGSGFYMTGVNFEGPAPRPLERARIVLADDGQILVDKSVKFQQEKGEWSKDESFLKV